MKWFYEQSVFICGTRSFLFNGIQIRAEVAKHANLIRIARTDKLIV